MYHLRALLCVAVASVWLAYGGPVLALEEPPDLFHATTRLVVSAAMMLGSAR
jgi:hypothetical protein